MAREVEADVEAIAYADQSAADAAALLRETVVRDAWEDLESEQKDGALATAARDLDTVDWIGERASDEQELEWPRTGTDYSDDAWPELLVRANIALALSYAPAFATGATANVLNPDPADRNIKKEKVGQLETEYFVARTVEATALERFPEEVQRLLYSLVRRVDANAWGSATVTRGS